MDHKKICVALNLEEGLNRYSQLFHGIQQFAEENANWRVTWNHYPQIRMRKIESGEELPYDGIIGRIDESMATEAKRLGIPVVNLWLNSSQTQLPASFFDFKKAIILATQHLLSRGFRSFVSINVNERASRQFIEGMKETLMPYPHEYNEIDYDPSSPDSPEAWEIQSEKFLKEIKSLQFPIAFCCGADHFPAINIFLENGIRIPEEVAFILTTDEINFVEGIKPGITSVHCNFAAVGYEGAKLLDTQIKGADIGSRKILIEPKEVIPRESTDSYVMDDDIVKKTLRFITDNIHKNIRMDDITEYVSLSYSALQKRFKEATGQTIKHEIDRVRIIQIKRLLSNDKIKINDIHKQTGFSSALNLRRVFFKATGMTPTEYRDSLNNA